MASTQEGHDHGGAASRAAFRTTTLVSGFEGKVECVTHYSSRVVVGSHDGQLVMYDTRKGPHSVSAKYSFDHGQRIEQIVAVPHIRMIMVVANGELSIHGATDLQPLPFDLSRANQFKVRLCCVNQRGPPHFRLGVALLRRKAVAIYQFHNTDKTYQFLREFPVRDVPEALAWYRNKVVVGYKKDYALVNDKSGDSVPINAAPIQQAQVAPAIKLLPKEEILINVMDRVGVFVGFNGEPMPRTAITWSQAPTFIEYTAPYLVGLLPRVGVEIHSLKELDASRSASSSSASSSSSSHVQLLSIPGARCIFGNGMKWDMEPRPMGDSEDVVIVGVKDGATSSVVRVEPMPLDQQIGDLLDRGKIDEAQDIIRKSVSGLPDDKKRSKMKRFQRQATVALLRRLEFEMAADYMYKAAVEPQEYIAFFPEFQCDSFAYEPSVFKPEVLPRGDSVSPDIRAVINEILHSHRMTLAPEIARLDPGELKKRATLSLMKFLELYKKHMRDKVHSRSRSVSSSRHHSVSSSTAPKDPRRAQAIDTAFFRLLVQFGKQKELLTLIQDSEYEGFCLEASSCEALLLKQRWYYELGQLLVSQGKHREALDVYSRLQSGEYVQSNAPQTGVEAAIALLISLPVESEDLVFEHSVWILNATDTRNALRIFTERKPPPATNEVVNHLKAKTSDPSIVQKYLETLVANERDNAGNTDILTQSTEEYTNFLAGEADDELEASSNVVDPHHTTLALEYIDEVLKLVDQGEAPSKSHPGKEGGGLGEARKRLLKFLKSSSSNYDVTPLVAKLKNTSLYNEYIILCGRGQLHDEAVETLVYDLNDIRGAESYCVKYGAKASSSQASTTNGTSVALHNAALLALVRLCLSPREESKKVAFHDFAFQVLARHGRDVDGKAVLDMLPASTPLHKLVEYFSLLLPNSAHNVRERMLMKHLSNIYNLQVQCERVEKRSQHVEIDTNTTCYACKKRIGDIVFAVYPNGRIVHYNCTNGNLDVCPVTGERFT